ncbi:Acetoacetyl-synthase [Pleurostoma richardsiae]|uniref:Acetoacetyl-synthase n=1 Tax=Pleurostoma richardsiae TaxID=41990 RepID=A0AA38RFU2_9PEZI|nr:Acetoacetyl-synthase [Pleurostoma richardsiae]
MGDGEKKKPVWEPRNSGETNVAKFIEHINRKHNLRIRTYDELHRWSVDTATLQDYWREAYTWLGLAPPGSREVGRMLESEDTVSVPLFPPPKFFPADSLNITEFLLRDGKDSDVAIHFAREGIPGVQRVTWRDLREQVRQVRDALLNSSVGVGDVVAAVISNSASALVLCLASLSVGAVWSSSSPDLGPDAIVDRYEQVDPKIIFADDGYIYAGKRIDLELRLVQWSQALGRSDKQLRDVVILPYCSLNPNLSRIYRGCAYESFLRRDTGQKLSFSILPFSHPAFILYSSGTTGKPKCIVHSAGGVALKVKSDMVLQHDIRKDDVVFQYTTTSWVMWVLNFVNISSGRSMLLYDGSPYHPSPTILLQLAEDVGVSIFGTSPRYLADLKSKGIVPRNQFDLSKLRVVTSTGSVLSADLYDWFYSAAFPPHAQLISMSGGTDISGCFVGGTPLLPVYAGEIQAKALGMAVDILDAARDDPVSVEMWGEAGELVCTKPFPSEPLEFHGKDGLEKYRVSYFDRFGPNIWCHGDYVQRLPDTGGLAVLGRSDGVLNPSGVRFGSAEIYAVTEIFPQIADCICVGQKRESDPDERVLLFVKMRRGAKFTKELEKRLKEAIRTKYTPRHVPRFVFEVADIPYTVNGKKCEINVKHIVSRRKAAISGTVANPDALDLYEHFQDLPGDGDWPADRESKL